MQKHISQGPAKREGAGRAVRRFQAERRLTALRLPGSVLRVAVLILDECDERGRFRRSQAAIADGLRVSVRTVKRAFARLRSLGFISTVYCGRHDVPVCFVQWSDWIKGGVSRLVAPVKKKLWNLMTLGRGASRAALTQVEFRKEALEARLDRLRGGPSPALVALTRRMGAS